MRFTGPFVTEDLPGGEDVWLIHADYSFIDSKGITHFVRAGTITDCASIPRLMWPFLGHPRDTDIGQTAALHDVLYKSGHINKSRCDEILCEGMEVLGAGRVKRALVYAGLAIGGWLAWWRYRQRDAIIPPDP